MLVESGPKLRHPYPDWPFDVLTLGGSPLR